MAITRITGGLITSASSAAETSRSITLPAVLDGDVAVVILGAFTSGGAPTITPPPGWMEAQALVQAGSSQFRLGAYLKVLTSAESAASPAWASSLSGQLTLVCRVYRGVDPSDPLDAAIATANGAASASVPCPSVTPEHDGAAVIAAYGQTSTSGVPFTNWTPPSSCTDAANGCSTVPSVNEAAVGTSHLIQGTAAPTGTLTATSPQSRAWAAMTIALRAAQETPPPSGGAGGGWGFIPI